MKKVSLVVEKFYQNNLVFSQDYNIETDGRLNKLLALKNRFNNEGYEIATNDIIEPKYANIIIYYDTIDNNIYEGEIGNRYLILIESVLVKPNIYDKKIHKYFNKVFTWNDKYINNSDYIKINLSHKLPKSIPKQINTKTKFCVIISTNRSSKYKNELYSERINAIRWFEKYHPEDFDLFGIGWNDYYIKAPRLLRIFNKIYIVRKILFKIFGTYYPSYKGKVKSKINVLKKYKYTICYENIKNIPGYITEKIFDAFCAGCIPIYLGADNINEYIPDNCYIDKRKYGTYEELYERISNINENEYLNYLKNIENYLTSKQANQFSDTYFANVIYENIEKYTKNIIKMNK